MGHLSYPGELVRVECGITRRDAEYLRLFLTILGIVLLIVCWICYQDLLFYRDCMVCVLSPLRGKHPGKINTKVNTHYCVMD